MNPFSWKWPFWISSLLLALLLAGAGSLFGADLGIHLFLLQLLSSCEEAVANGSAMDTLPDADWQCALFIGLLLGAFAAAAAGGEFKFDVGCEEAGSRSFGKFIRSALAGVLGGALVFTGILLTGNSIWGEWRAVSSGTGGGWLFLLAFLLAGAVAGCVWRKVSSRIGSEPAAGQKAKEPGAAQKPAKKVKKGGKK